MSKKVAIYTTPTCVYCRMTKEFFKQKNISYTEYNVAADVPRREEMINKSGQMGVPVITVLGEEDEEQVIIGFDKHALGNAIGH